MLVNKNPIFEKAVNKLLYVSADEKLRYELDMREKAELDYWSAMKSNFRKGKEEGVLIGLAEGKAEGVLEIAQKLKKLGMPSEQISLVTGLTVKAIEELPDSETDQ